MCFSEPNSGCDKASLNSLSKSQNFNKTNFNFDNSNQTKRKKLPLSARLTSFKAWTHKKFPQHLSGPLVEEIVFHGASGGQGVPTLRNINGTQERVALRAEQRDGALGEIDAGAGIDYAALTSLPEADEELKLYVRMLTDISVFETEMSKLPEQGPPGIRRGTSRFMARHKENLERWRVVRETMHVRAITNYFTVSKKNGTLRLVVDARKINALMRRVPKMELPVLNEVLLLLLCSKYFITVDGTSYFYQFHISEKVGELFCANLAGARGEFTTVALTRMPMGWNWAPAIAQKTSNTLLKMGDSILGKAWVDNFIFVGSTRENVWKNFVSFRDRADICNVKIDNREPAILERGEVLGVEVNLQTSEFRMAPSWAEKAKLLRIRSWMTPREIYEVTGNCIWACCVREWPLCSFSDQIDIVRRVALLVHAGMHWDTPLHLSREETEALSRWKAQVEDNSWSTIHSKRPPTEEIWTDASSYMWAYTNLSEKCDQGFFIDSQICWHIFIKEAYAVHRSMASAKGVPRLYRVDNMPLVLAMKRKVSSNKLVNRWMSGWDWDNISVEWVPTTEQRADIFTRGGIMECKRPREPTTTKRGSGRMLI